MSGRYDAKIGDDVTLEATFTVGGEPFDVEVEKVELVNDSLVTIDTVEGVNVVRTDVGKYEVTFLEVSQSGVLCDHWSYKPTSASATQVAAFSVTVVGVDGEAGEGPAPDPAPVPDIGVEGTCLVTHRFLDASGDALPGVYVRFRPVIHNDAVTQWGTVARDADAVSDSDGNLRLYLVRGVKGMLAITGVGLVRQVTVPDLETCPLYDLIPGSVDLFEVQSLDQVIDLPKRS